MNFENNRTFDMVFGMDNVSPDKIKKATVIIHNVSRKEVENKDYRGIEKLFSVLRSLKTEARGKLMLQFAGYDDISDEIYEIPEIREYVMGMFQRWPEMFYFLTQEDVIYRVILACIVDVAIVHDIEKKGIDRVVFDGEQLTPVYFALSIPDNIREAIRIKLKEYGRKIGESEEVMSEVIENILDLKKGIKSDDDDDEDYQNINLWNIYEATSKKCWTAFVRDIKSFKIIYEHKLINFIEKNRDIINMAIAIQSLVVPIITKNKFTNIFVIRDEAYGLICPTCHSSTVLVFKKNMFSSIKDWIFIPSFENYINKRILPLSDKFIVETPVPISPLTDKWICPNCLEIHSFKYNSKTGLQY